MHEMNNENNPEIWARYAEDDYEVARGLARHKRPKFFVICFHAQQSAEKYLKALLVVKQNSFPKTHDLEILNDLCSQTGIDLNLNDDELDELTSYAVQIRYPAPDPTPDADQMKRALEIAKKVRHICRKCLGLKKSNDADILGTAPRIE